MDHHVLMVCRNALALTKEAVQSVMQQDIVVKLTCYDNASTDGTDSWLSEVRGDRIHHVNVAAQESVSAAWNHMLFFLFGQTEHVLVVNADVVLRPDTYRELLADGGGFVTGVGVGDRAQIEGQFVKGVSDHPDFSCFLIRKETWEKVGPFDEKFEVAYCEDLDYHVRMHRAGIRAVNIGMPFYHHVSGTIKNAPAIEAERIRSQADKNRDYFKRKWGVAVGSSEYYSLFIPKNFGVEESVAKEKG